MSYYKGYLGGGQEKTDLFLLRNLFHPVISMHVLLLTFQNNSLQSKCQLVL